jgi:hypothetical protein
MKNTKVIVGLGVAALGAFVLLRRAPGKSYTFYVINPPPDATMWSVSVIYQGWSNPIDPKVGITSPYVLDWENWMKIVGYPDLAALEVHVDHVFFNFNGNSVYNWRQTGAITLNVVMPAEDGGTIGTLDWAGGQFTYNALQKGME